MYLEIESEAKNFTKCFWNFWEFSVPSDIFSDFSSIFGDFSNAAQNRSTSWIWSTESIEPSMVYSAQTMLKMRFFVLKPILDIISPPSELFSQFSISKSPPNFLFHFLTSHTLQFLMFSLDFSKSPNFLQTLTASTTSGMAPKAGSKRKGNKPIHEDSPPHFDYSEYPSLEAFKRYSTRAITFGRIVKFDHLDFIGFNQLMRRMGWLTFARLSEPCYPNLIRRFQLTL